MLRSPIGILGPTDRLPPGEILLQRLAFLALGIMGLWLLLSGHFDTLLLTLGAIATGLVVYVAERMSRSKEAEEQALSPKLLLRLLVYIPWLIKEVFVANV